HRIVLPASTLFGAAFLVLCDLAARTLFSPLEIPVGIVTALIGGPFFLWLLFKGHTPGSRNRGGGLGGRGWGRRAWGLGGCALWCVLGAQTMPKRIVSLVPATTEMLFAMGVGDRIVGVGNYDRFPPEVSRLPRVGGLVDPDTERILALRPDLVVLYATQVELR